MKRIFTLATILFAGFVSLTVHAASVTVDFEEFNVGDTGAPWLVPLESQGFDISGAYAGGFLAPAEIIIGTNTGTKSFGGTIAGPGQDSYGVIVQIWFERSDGGAFSLHSLDLLMDADEDGSTAIVGTLSGGGYANLNTPVGTGDWLNLESLYFEAVGNPWGVGYATVELDNVVVSAVPIPAAIWLFGSALVGLGWVRRKQTL